MSGAEHERKMLSNEQISEIIESIGARIINLGDWMNRSESSEAAAIKEELVQLAEEIKTSFEMAIITEAQHTDLKAKWKEAVRKLNEWTKNAIQELNPTAQA